MITSATDTVAETPRRNLRSRRGARTQSVPGRAEEKGPHGEQEEQPVGKRVFSSRSLSTHGLGHRSLLGRIHDQGMPVGPMPAVPQSPELMTSSTPAADNECSPLSAATPGRVATHSPTLRVPPAVQGVAPGGEEVEKTTTEAMTPPSSRGALLASMAAMQADWMGVIKELREENRELRARVEKLTVQLEKLVEAQTERQKKLYQDGTPAVQELVKEASTKGMYQETHAKQQQTKSQKQQKQPQQQKPQHQRDKQQRDKQQRDKQQRDKPQRDKQQRDKQQKDKQQNQQQGQNQPQETNWQQSPHQQQPVEEQQWEVVGKKNPRQPQSQAPCSAGDVAGTSFARVTAMQNHQQPKPAPASSRKQEGSNAGNATGRDRTVRPNNKGRLDVITVTPPAGVPFFDVFRKVREHQETADAVKKASRISRNTLEMQLKKSADSKETLRRVKAIAPEGCEIVLRVDTVKLQLRGVDMLAEKSDVAEAIGLRFGEEIPENDVILQRYSRGDQRAFVRVPRRIANALVGDRLVFGYSRCRVELAPLRPMSRTRCNRCQLIGHMARSCRGPDRSALCRRCGSNGHKAAQCLETTRCLVCEGPHAVGSAHCENRRGSSQ